MEVMEVDPVTAIRATSRGGPDQLERERVASGFRGTRDGDVVAISAHRKAEGDGTAGTVLAGGRSGSGSNRGPGWERRAEAG